jgi:signal peptidase
MRLLRFGGLVLAWLLILVALASIAAAVLVPRLSGATPYTVLTGSMRPHLPPGTLVVVKPVDPDELQVGDVVTYQLESGESTVVTHRITSVDTRLDGKTVFTTQGDANDVPDPAQVLPVQVRGRLWYAVPYLGYVNNALNGAQRQVAVLVVSTALIGYAAFMFVGAVRDRRRSRTATEPEPGPTADAETTPQLHPTGVTAGPADSRGNAGAPIVVLAATAAAFTALLLLFRRRTRP